MRLLVDTDAFCIFAAASLLESVAEILGVDIANCQRLPALPHMLDRGNLRRKLGDELADQLKPRAASLSVVSDAPSHWLDQLVGISGIDAGEAQLFALAAESEILVLTGDRRALRALKDVPRVVEALKSKVVIPTAALFGLCSAIGEEELRRKMEPALHLDRVLEVCFSKNNLEPLKAVVSYLRADCSELAPLAVWRPQGWSE
jgi:hypothetical protein